MDACAAIDGEKAWQTEPWANEHKRSAGKREMMKRLGMLAARRAEEAALIAAAPAG